MLLIRIPLSRDSCRQGGEQEVAMGTLKVMIVDDHKIFAEGLRQLLISQNCNVEVVATASNGFEAINVAVNTKPDVILMDLEMPGCSGVQATQVIKKRLPACKIIILTMHAEDQFLEEAKTSGADAYLLKDASVEELKSTITEHCCEKYRVKNKPKGPRRGVLSIREMEILELAASGLTNDEIAEKLFLSAHTIKNHFTHIFNKLNCRNRAQAVKSLNKLKVI